MASWAGSVSGSLSFDVSTAHLLYATLNGNVTSLAFTNPTTDGILEVHLIQDGTGSRTLSGAASSIKWTGGAAPTLTTTAGRRDIFQFRVSGGNFYELPRSMNVG